jgi:hypothetical protein
MSREGNYFAFSWPALGHFLRDLGLRESGGTQAASGALLGAGDGSNFERAGSTEEGDGGPLIVPDLGSAASVADDDGRGRGFFERETEVLAGDGPGRAVTTEVGRDLVFAQGDLGAEDAPIGGHAAMLTQTVTFLFERSIHEKPPLYNI